MKSQAEEAGPSGVAGAWRASLEGGFCESSTEGKGFGKGLFRIFINNVFYNN
jgi:hypothetical protein